MKVICPLCKFESEFNWTVNQPEDKDGNKYPESLKGIMFFYNCPNDKCDAPLNLEVILEPNEKDFKLKVNKRKVDYIQ